jgi:Fe-S oxidoreductase
LKTLSSGKDPQMIPAHKVRFLKEILKKKGKVDRDFLQKVYHTVYHECNMCRRCTMYCPFGIDIALMISLLRSLLLSQAIVPEGLLTTVKNYNEFGNQMAISKEDWVDTVEWCEEETADELVGLKIPIDKKGAKILYTVNAREPKFYPQDIMEVAKIFHVAGEDYTLPSEDGWDGTNLAMFCGDAKTARLMVENTFKRRSLSLNADTLIEHFGSKRLPGWDTRPGKKWFTLWSCFTITFGMAGLS